MQLVYKTYRSIPQLSLGWWAVIKSVLAAMIGIQSTKNRTRDFKQGKPIHYVMMGIIMTALFVLTLVSVVKLILP